MSDNDARFEPEPDLDAVIREAAPALTREIDRPDEAVVLAYLSGTADSTEIQTVREALTRSRAYRRELVDFWDELERLQDPELERAFDAGLIDSRSAARKAARELSPQPAPSPQHEPFRLGPWLARLFARPAFAVAMIVLILAYPAWQLLRSPGDGPLVLAPGAMEGRPSVTFYLRFDRDITLRGEDDPIPARTLTVTSSPAAVDLRLQAPAGAAGGDRFDVSLRHENETLWHSSEPRAVVSVDEDLIIPLTLEPDRLPEGTVTVEARSADPPAGSDPESTRYRFRVERAATEP